MAEKQLSMHDYVIPLYINGLDGRLLRYPNLKRPNREILLVYGRHASLERWWQLAQVLHVFGTVTMPDLPGFGGMDSFYQIHRVPSLDNMADYLASVVKLRYKKKPFITVGVGYGFTVVTRMLQRYPEIAKQVRVVVSIAGYADHDDIVQSQSKYYIHRYTTWILKQRFTSYLFTRLYLSERSLRKRYVKQHEKLNESIEQRIAEDISLWQANDFRTHVYTLYEMLTFTNCHEKVSLPVHQVGLSGDKLFDNPRVEQHLRVIFSDLNYYPVKNAHKAIDLIASRRYVSALIPPKLKVVLRRTPMRTNR